MMSVINGSVVDGDLRQQIHQSIDLKKQVHAVPELKSSPIDDDLLEFLSSLESMLTEELEGDKSPEMEVVVHPSIENEEDACEEMGVKLLKPKVLKSEESEEWTDEAVSPPTSVISMEMDPPNPTDVSEVDSGDRMPSVVMMACRHCYLYVLLSEFDADPKCLKCGLSDLFDPFRENSGLRRRRN